VSNGIPLPLVADRLARELDWVGGAEELRGQLQARGAACWYTAEWDAWWTGEADALSLVAFMAGRLAAERQEDARRSAAEDAGPRGVAQSGPFAGQVTHTAGRAPAERPEMARGYRIPG
jgi:hypothetical protein